MKYINFMKYFISKLIKTDVFMFIIFGLMIAGIIYLGFTWPIHLLISLTLIFGVLTIIKFMCFTVETWDEYNRGAVKWKNLSNEKDN